MANPILPPSPRRPKFNADEDTARTTRRSEDQKLMRDGETWFGTRDRATPIRPLTADARFSDATLQQKGNARKDLVDARRGRRRSMSGDR